MPNALLGLLVFIVAEVMLFAALIRAFLVSGGGGAWPADLPRLPLAMTAANTAGLLLSGATMILAIRRLRQGRLQAFRAALGATTLLGLAFLALQGFEWARLVRQGLTLQAGVYGGIFYALVGLHALHVLGAVIWLCVVFLRALAGPSIRQGPLLCAVYWEFVVALWAVLFALVYL